MNKNESIKCTVEQCKHHACSENYCTLNSISIGTHKGACRKIPAGYAGR